MSIASGLDSQWGFSPETTPGTRVTPATFLPYLSEGITHTIDRNVSKGLRAGRRTQSVWRAGRQMARGPINFELAPQGFVKLGKWMFGAVSTSGSGPYTHTLTPGTLDDEAMSMQLIKTTEAGTALMYDYYGCQCTDWTIGVKVGELVTCSVGIEAMKAAAIDTHSRESASYPSGWNPFSYLSGSVTIAGSAYEPEEISLKGTNGLAVGRHRIKASTPEWPVVSREAAFRQYTGTLNGDLFSATAYNRFISGTEAALVLTLSDGASASLTITTNVRFDGETAKVQGDQMIKQALPFVCVGSTDAAAITAVLVSSDAS